MTDAATEAPASVNGAAPAAAPDEPDTGERWLGTLAIAAGVFLVFIGIDRVTGGALTAPFYGGGDGEG